MNISNKWAVRIICTLVAIIFGLCAFLFLRNSNQDSSSLARVEYGSTSSKGSSSSSQDEKARQAKTDLNAKPLLPIEARFVSFGGKNYLKITSRAGADLDGELAVEVSKWKGAGSKHESTTIRLIKKDNAGVYFETPPNPKVVPDYYVYRIHFPQLYYNIGIYGGSSWREYYTYLPGDTVQILNALCEPIVIQCPLKVSEQSDIKPETKGKIDFVRK
jgi:hypothetical protein